MLRVMKRSLIASIDWFLYQFLSTTQKEKMANILTEKQKEKLKKIINPGKKRAQIRKIERMKYRLYELGFSNRSIEDFKALAAEEGILRKYAAWELAVWYVNQYSKRGAEQSLYYLKIALEGEKDSSTIRRAKVLQAECYARLGEVEQAIQLLRGELQHSKHVDLYLGLVSLIESAEEKMLLLNEMYRTFQVSPISFANGDDQTLYDRLIGTTEREVSDQGAKVSVIIPAYNCAETIGTAIESMFKQTWNNLEILVVDDCSKDHTKDVIMRYANQDQRVNYLSTPTNGGAYVARNIALQIATGDYVTINDADDWSHPEKIEIQVRHLEANRSVIANFSNQARTTNQLTFYRRGKPGIYMFANMSSFMFRRKNVIEKIGFWDSVRFAGDSELVKRVKCTFGERSVVSLDTAPLSFQRQTEDSLTGNSAFGFPGYFMGARKEYKDAHETYHKSGKSLYYPFPQEERPFPVPEPMWPKREDKPDGRRHFDVIIASEFRLLGGTNMSNVEEIKAQRRLGLRTGLVQLSRYDLNSATEMNPQVRELLGGDQVSMLVYGEKVSCDVLIVRHPPILEEWQKYVPD
ncbi:glycosyltransferase, partial [Halalkalibacter sp. AB-rgal2]|uniref:glycosyltransferase n=1 Tax=Halalkalibacter sp. AB-rgal2 TaxID=3242695 RepID=UPI00359EBF13